MGTSIQYCNPLCKCVSVMISVDSIMFNVSAYVICPVLPLIIVAVSVGTRVEGYGDGHASVTFKSLLLYYEHDLLRVAENW